MTNSMDNVFQSAFDNYFATEPKQDNTGVIAKPNDVSYTYKPDSNIRQNVERHTYKTNVGHLTADDNIDTIEEICNIIKPLLNAAWGTEWGELSPSLKRGEDSDKIILPQIVAEVNERDIADKMPLKPVLTDTIKEVVDDKETGDSLLIYRQWFDCNIEFDFYGRTSKEVRDLQNKFETIVQIYTGYLKRHGVSEFFFLREMSSRNSLNFVEQVPMKCLIFYMRLERIIPIRVSLINKINAEVGVKQLSNDKINTIIEHNNKISVFTESTQTYDISDDFDIDFENTGNDYSDI